MANIFSLPNIFSFLCLLRKKHNYIRNFSSAAMTHQSKVVEFGFRNWTLDNQPCTFKLEGGQSVDFGMSKTFMGWEGEILN